MPRLLVLRGCVDVSDRPGRVRRGPGGGSRASENDADVAGDASVRMSAGEALFQKGSFDIGAIDYRGQ